MAKVANTMSTEIRLDTENAQQGLKQLTANVKSTEAAFKSQEATLKSAGDSLGASKARYEGLGQVIESQKGKIDSIRHSLENNNTTTKAGQELQDKLNAELTKAEQKYASYQGQLEKAHQSLKYQESGLATLSNELKHNNDLTAARVERLKAEGNQEEANKVHVQGLTTAHEKQSQILKIQKAELAELETTQGKSSTAYKRQAIRVEQVGAQLAHTTSKMKSFNETGLHVKAGGLDGAKVKLDSLKSSMHSVGEQSHKLTVGFGKLVGAQLAARSIGNAFGFVKSHITGAVGAGAEFNKQMEAIQTGMMNFTGNNKKLADSLTNDVKALHEQTGYTAGTMAALMKSAYGIEGKDQSKAKQLAKDFANLGRATGKSDEDMTKLMTTIKNSSASGAINDSAITKLTKQMPGYRAQLQKTMNVNSETLDQMLKDGKVTSKNLTDTISDMSKAKPHGLENYYTTFDGFTKHFESRYKGLAGKVTGSFFQANNTMLKGLSKSLDGAGVDKAFGRIGETANTAISSIVKAFSNVFGGSKKNPIETMANGTANVIEKMGKTISDHAGDIKKFFVMVKDLGASGFSTMGIGLKLALPLLESVGKFASQHQTTFKVLAGSVVAFGLAFKGVTLATNAYNASMTVARGAMVAWSAVTKTFTAVQWALNVALNANPLGLIVIAITAVIGGLALLYTKFKPFRDFVNGLGKWIAKIFGGVIDFFKNNWKQIGVFLINPFAGIAALLYKHFKPFRELIDNTVKFVKNVFGSLKKWFSDLWDSVGKIFSKAWNGIINGIKGYIKWCLDLYRGLWNGIVGIFNGLVKSVQKIVKAMWDWLSDTFGKGIKAIVNLVVDMWNNVRDTFSNLFKSAKDVFGSMFKWLGDFVGDKLKGITDTFSNAWKSVGDGFSKLWDKMKELAADGINLVINPINSGIDGINGLIHNFGGSKETIGHIPKAKFADGTRNAITETTHAVLNDGHDSPATGNKEMIVLPNGKAGIVQGRNTEMLLPAGTEVIKASDTAKLMAQLGVRHFASGTGWWDKLKGGASDAWDSTKKVAGDTWDATKDVAGKTWDKAKDGAQWASDKVVDGYDWVKDEAGKIKNMLAFIGKAVAHPIDTLRDFFNPKNDGVGNIMKSVADGFIKKPVKQAQDWFTQVWKMADGEANGSNATGDDYGFKDKAKDSGADPWGYYFRECVSFVANRLKNMGVPEGLFTGLGNGSDWVNAKVTHTDKPEPGMVAVYGPGSPFSSNHVAMVSDVKGDTISGEEYNYGENGQYNAYSGRSTKDVTTFLDFGKRMMGKASKATGGLTGFIEKQLGGMMKWIKKFISPKSSASSGTSGDVQSWSNDVKRALRANGLSDNAEMVSKVLKQIQTESGGNAGVTQQIQDINSGGNEAQGLMQVIPSTFSAYKHSGHDNIKNGYDNILAALAYAKSRYGDNLNGLGEGHGYANGGLITKHHVAHLGEGNLPEYVIPLDKQKSSRGFELLGQTVTAMAARDNLSTEPTADKGVIEKLEAKFDKMVDLLSTLVTQGQQPSNVQAIVNPHELYRRQALDMQLNGYQAL